MKNKGVVSIYILMLVAGVSFLLFSGHKFILASYTLQSSKISGIKNQSKNILKTLDLTSFQAINKNFFCTQNNTALCILKGESIKNVFETSILANTKVLLNYPEECTEDPKCVDADLIRSEIDLRKSKVEKITIIGNIEAETLLLKEDLVLQAVGSIHINQILAPPDTQITLLAVNGNIQVNIPGKIKIRMIAGKSIAYTGNNLIFGNDLLPDIVETESVGLLNFNKKRLDLLYSMGYNE